MQLSDGKSETIFSATKNVVEDLGLDSFSSFGSDGCNTMIGRKNGVSTKLKELKPDLINIHCHNHRLALAAKNSFESIPMFNDLDLTISHVHKYYHGSAVRSQSLEKMQKMFNETENAKTIKKAGHTRWLSHLNAVTSLRDAYPAVISDLENSCVSGKDIVRLGSGPSAAGLVKKLKSLKAVHIIHFLCDALKPVANLSLVFQKNNIDLCSVHPRLESTITALKKLKVSEGPSMKKVQNVLDVIGVSESEQELQQVKAAENKFIDNLIENITQRLENSEIIDKMAVFNFRDNFSADDSLYGNDEMTELSNHHNLDVDEVLYEWDEFKTNVVKDNYSDLDGPVSVTKLISKVSRKTGNTYPNIFRLACQASVLPLSTAEVERMFSDVTRTVTILRNRLKVESTHQLLMIHHNKHYIDFHKIGMKWLSMGNRRIAKYYK